MAATVKHRFCRSRRCSFRKIELVVHTSTSSMYTADSAVWNFNTLEIGQETGVAHSVEAVGASEIVFRDHEAGVAEGF